MTTTITSPHDNLSAIMQRIQVHVDKHVDKDGKQDFEAQRQVGKCDMTPMPQVAMQPFRSDLTIERHPIFVVNSFKGNHLTITRTIRHPTSNEPVEQRIYVGKIDGEKESYGVLKQVHQTAFYSLLKLWGEQGYPLSGNHGFIKATVYDIVKRLRGNNSVAHYRRTRGIVRGLSSIPITVENACTPAGLQTLKEFTLLADVTWTTRDLDKKTLRPIQGGESSVIIYFSQIITEGFLRKNVKQLLWQPYASLGNKTRPSEVARLLYPVLDHELSSKDTYHASLRTLAYRFGMKPQAYKSDRKRPFLNAARQLKGLPVLSEKHRIQINFRESADGQDFILIARKSAAQLRRSKGL